MKKFKKDKDIFCVIDKLVNPILFPWFWQDRIDFKINLYSFYEHTYRNIYPLIKDNTK